MHKLTYILILCSSLFIAACNGTNQTGGTAIDSSGSNGNSGPADTSKNLGQATPGGTNTGGTDPTSNGKGVTNPTVDSTRN